MQVKRSTVDRLMRGLYSAKSLVSKINKKALVSSKFKCMHELCMHEICMQYD